MKNRISAPVDVMKPGTYMRSRAALEVALQLERLTGVLNLASIIEQNEPHRPADGNQVLGVEQQALVAADDDAAARVLGTDAPQIVAAYAVAATKDQSLEDGQRRVADGLDVLHLPAQTEGGLRRVTQEPRAFERRIDVLRVAADACDAQRRRVAAARGRRNRVVDRVQREGRRDLADRPLARPPR